MHRVLSLVLLLLALALVAPAVASAERFVSPTGSNDANPCTAAAPCLTIRRGVESAAAGETITVADGTYGAVGLITRVSSSGTATAPKVVRPAAGATPTHIGHFDIDASNVRFTGLEFVGPTGDLGGNGLNGEQVLIAVNGANVEIDHSSIHGGRGHAGIYGYSLSGGVRIHHNHIWDNGNRASANFDHGIYWELGPGARIENNLIERNVARGVQLYPDAQNVVVNNNTIVNNGGSGVQFGTRAAGNVIENNIIAGNGHRRDQPGVYNVDSRETNTVRNNVIFANTGGPIIDRPETLVQSGNVFTNPGFVSATLGSFSTGNNFHILSTSPAVGLAGPGAAATDYDDQLRDSDPDSGYDEVQRAAPTRIGSSSAAASASSLLTIPAPVGVQSGDVMVAQFGYRGGVGVTAPAGWTLVRAGSANNGAHMAVYYKVATAGEPASYAWSGGGVNDKSGGITAWRGVDNTSPIAASSTAVGSTAGFSPSAPSVLTTDAKSPLLHFVSFYNFGSLTPPQGMAERWDARTTSAFDVESQHSDQMWETPGQTGSRTSTATGQSGQWSSALVALNPA